MLQTIIHPDLLSGTYRGSVGVDSGTVPGYLVGYELPSVWIWALDLRKDSRAKSDHHYKANNVDTDRHCIGVDFSAVLLLLEGE